VKGQPLSYINGHNPTKLAPLYIIEPETGCWVWQRGGDRYGVHWHPEEKRNVLAHRFIYERERGPIPDGYQLHHLCRNKRCVNPDHLELLVSRDHVRKERGRVSAEQILRIRGMAADGVRQTDIAEQMGIGQMTVSDIVTGISWTDQPRLRRPRKKR
jgi:hypothetical protein